MYNRQIFSLLLLVVMLGLGYWVVKPFLVPVAWAAIIAFLTWPAYRRLRQPFEQHSFVAALIMTTLLIILLVLPISWFLVRMQSELVNAYETLASQFSDRPLLLLDAIARIPIVGSTLHDLLTNYWNDPLLWKQPLKDWFEPLMHELTKMIGKIAGNFLKLMITGISLFFFYRNGDQLLEQIRKGLGKVVGEPAEGYFRVVGETTHAVVYGLIVSALAQGLVAGIGYKIIGIGTPILLGTLTAITSLIPFIGTVLIWGPIGVWLLLSNHIGAGLGLLAWGTVVVHPTDNILRPLLISSASDIPLLIVVFGVVGGLFAFGIVGMFLGPLILAVLLAIWREWLGNDQPKPTDSV